MSTTPMSTTPLFTPTPTPAPIFAAPNTPAPTPSLTPAFVSATPAGGPYGQWAIANPYCVSLFTLSLQVQTLMLAWAIICTCQTIFLMSRWPRTGWEIVFTPAIQAIVYGLGYQGVGYVTLGTGQIVAFARFFMMISVSPTLLIDVNKLAAVKFFGINVNTMQVVVSVVMWAFWLASTMSADIGMKWMFFVFGLTCLFIIFTCSYFIFAAAREGFLSKRTEAGDWVAARILILEIIFFTTWAGYMILWAISGEVGCVAAEVVIIPIFICLDLLQKNIFGLIIWSTLWNFLGGSWNPDRLQDERAPSRLEGLKVVQNVTHLDDEIVDDGPPYGQSTVHTSADMIMRGTPKMQPATFLAQSYPSTFLPPWRGPINGAGSVVGADIEVSQINKSTHYIPRSSPHTHTSHTHASAARKSLDEVVDHVRSLNQALSDLMVLDKETREQRSHASIMTSSRGPAPENSSSPPRAYASQHHGGYSEPSVAAPALYVHHGRF